MSWPDGVIAAFDIETTGIDPDHDELVQAAVVHVDVAGQLMPGSWSKVIDPGRPIPPEAAEVHGITDDRVRREGIPLADGLREILERLDAVASSGTPLVVYNAPFDLSFMHVRARRIGRSLPHLTVVDPLVCDREFDKYRKGSRRLGDVARHYGCETEGLHDAATDAVTSVAVSRAITRAFDEIREMSLGDLHQAQVGWYRDWAANYADWRIGQGLDASDVDPGWPIRARLRSGLPELLPEARGNPGVEPSTARRLSLADPPTGKRTQTSGDAWRAL